MDRLRRTNRAPCRDGGRRLPWLQAWRRKREPIASTGTADIA
jgi:hypothetical protein